MSATRVWRGAVMFAAAAMCSAMLATEPAAATPPTTTQIDATFAVQVTDLCDFPIDINGTQTGTERDFIDRNGQITKSTFHLVEQDTFTANGKTLAGLPFVNELKLLFDSAGQLVHAYEVGVIERVPLPDGSMFLSAGRLDFVAHPGVSILITPDVGHAGNLAGFCQALSA